MLAINGHANPSNARVRTRPDQVTHQYGHKEHPPNEILVYRSQRGRATVPGHCPSNLSLNLIIRGKPWYADPYLTPQTTRDAIRPEWLDHKHCAHVERRCL